MDLREQQYFIRIVEEGSISRAAQKLNISQSALSQHLLKLEQEVGTVQIRRARVKDPEMTEAGRCYYECCRSMLFDWERAQQDINALNVKEYTELKIGLSNTANGIRLFRFLPMLMEKYPGLQFRFEDGRGTQWTNKLLQGDYQLVIAGYEEEHPKLVYHCLEESVVELGVPCGHRLAQYSYLNPGQENTEISLRDLEDEPLLIMDPATIMGYGLRKWFIRENFIPRVAASFTNISVLKCAVEESGVVGFTSTAKQVFFAGKDILPVRIRNSIRFRKGIIYRKDQVLTPLLEDIFEIMTTSDTEQAEAKWKEEE